MNQYFLIPQMVPMAWMSLYIISSTMLFMFILMNYYMNICKSTQKMTNYDKNLNWSNWLY